MPSAGEVRLVGVDRLYSAVLRRKKEGEIVIINEKSIVYLCCEHSEELRYSLVVLVYDERNLTSEDSTRSGLGGKTQHGPNRGAIWNHTLAQCRSKPSILVFFYCIANRCAENSYQGGWDIG